MLEALRSSGTVVLNSIFASESTGELLQIPVPDLRTRNFDSMYGGDPWECVFVLGFPAAASTEDDFANMLP